MYKAIFIDIDGTLLRSDHSLSEATLKVLRRLDQQQIIIVLVSARPFSGIVPILKELKLSGMPVASLNGAYIIHKNKMLFGSVIDLTRVAEVYKVLEKYQATSIYYEQDNWFSETGNIHIDHEQKITNVPIVLQPFLKTMEFWKKRNTAPNKILVISDAISILEIQNKMKMQFGDYLNICTSKPTFLEIMNLGATKLNAVKLISSLYGIDLKEIIAIGDNYNDIEMIANTGLGIAMGNAPDEVKSLAKYVAETNDQDGVAKSLTKFFDLGNTVVRK